MEDKIKSLEEAVRILTLRLDRLEGINSRPLPEIPRTESLPTATPFSMGKLLAFISVICFILAASFIVKLAITSGWLTPERQWVMVVTLGAALCGLGRYLEKIEINYRSYLSGAGVVVLYIAAYSSSLYFGLVSQEFSLVIGMLVSVVALSLFNYHRNELFSLLAVTGTYLSILLLRWEYMGLILSSSYFLLWALVFSWFSSYFKSRHVSLLASYQGLGLYTLLNLNVVGHDSLLVVLLVLGLQFLIFGYGVYFYSLKNNEQLSKGEAWGYFPVLCFYYGTSYYYLNVLSPEVAPWIGLGFAIFLLLGYQGIKKQLKTLDVTASQQMVYSFLAVVLFQAGYLEVLPRSATPWLLPLFIILSYIKENKADFPQVSTAFQYLATIIGFIEFIKLCWSMLGQSSGVNEVMAAVSTIGLGIFYYLNMGKLVQARTGSFLSCVHALAVLGLLNIARPYGSLYVSIAWAAYAVMILVLGFMRKDEVLAKSSLLVLLVASLKALIYDASQAPTGIRIVCLLVTGLLLYGTGYLFQKMQGWKKV